MGFTKCRKFQSQNDSVFEIKLIKPFPAFLGLMTMKYASVVQKKLLNTTVVIFVHTIGTGPSNLNYGKKM
jgi:peptide/nickel transport system substrate-binding protein